LKFMAMSLHRSAVRFAKAPRLTIVWCGYKSSSRRDFLAYYLNLNSSVLHWLLKMVGDTMETAVRGEGRWTVGENFAADGCLGSFAD